MRVFFNYYALKFPSILKPQVQIKSSYKLISLESINKLIR